MVIQSPIKQFDAENSTVTQQRLLVLLYDRLVRDLDDAEAGIRIADLFVANSALLHAQEIVAELEKALDPDVWDAAKELASLYVYIQGRLIQANLANDLQALEDARSAIGPLREAWSQAWQSIEANSTTQRATSTDVHSLLDISG